MVPLNTTTGRSASARGRRPEDAPALAAVPSAPTSGKAATAAPAGLPEALAAAVLDPKAPPKTEPRPPKARTAEPAAPPTSTPERDQGAEPTAPETAPTGTEATQETAVVAVESRSAAEAERAIKWLGVTFRPPDVWRERQPSLAEEWDFVMDGSHLPDREVWRAAARGYAAPAIGLITALHFLIWVLRSPARHATAWAVVLLIAGSAHLML